MLANLQSATTTFILNFRNKSKKQNMVFAWFASQLVQKAITANNVSTHLPGNPDVILQTRLSCDSTASIQSCHVTENDGKIEGSTSQMGRY